MYGQEHSAGGSGSIPGRTNTQGLNPPKRHDRPMGLFGAIWQMMGFSIFLWVSTGKVEHFFPWNDPIQITLTQVQINVWTTFMSNLKLLAPVVWVL